MRPGDTAHAPGPMRTLSPARAPATLLAAMAAALLLSAAPAAAIPGDWTPASRAFATHASVSPDIAVQPDGTPHIAMDGGPTAGIWYATRVGTTWEETQVTTGDDHSPSIALDGDIVVIAFRRTDAGDQGIFTVTNASGDWVITKRHDGTDGAPSLALDDATAHLAFVGDGALRYATGAYDSETTWPADNLDGTCCSGPPSLALGPDGRPRIAYPDGTPAAPGALVVQTKGSGGWNRKVVDTHKVSSPALSIDGTKAYVAYIRRGAGTWYAALSGTKWSMKALDSRAKGPPDVSAFSGAIAFVWGNAGNLKLATMSGGIILTRSFSRTSGDRRPRIVRQGGKPHVVFLRQNGGGGDGAYWTHQK